MAAMESLCQQYISFATAIELFLESACAAKTFFCSNLSINPRDGQGNAGLIVMQYRNACT